MISDGPAESHRKPIVFSLISSSSSSSNYSWSSLNSISPSDENAQNSYHQFNNMLQLKHQQQQPNVFIHVN